VVVDKPDSRKIMNVFKVIVNSQENTIYQELVKDLIVTAKKHDYRREKGTGVVYKQVRPYAYVRYKDAMDFLNEIFYGDEDFRSNVNNMDNLVKYMKQYDDPDFPFYVVNEEYLGFRNGILNIITLEFTEVERYVESSLVVRKYFDHDFNYKKDTPCMDVILDYQFSEEVRDFIYACLGRLFKIRDNYGFMLYLMGEPCCGKSVIIDVMCECFDKIGVVGDSFEQKYGLAYLYNKDIIVCDDLPKDIQKVFPQQVFQSIVTMGKVSTAVKNGDALNIDWKVPLLWAGNWFPNFYDKGQVSRRLIVANFEKNVYNPDPSLKTRIIREEMPALIYKCLTYYKKLLTNTNGDIWHICPEYFLEQQQELKIERNPLFKFLIENTKYKENASVKIDDIRNEFSNWLGKKVTKLDHGTFGQVNKEYIIEAIQTCKFCGKEHKRGCCDLYNSKGRTNKKYVKNIEVVSE